MFKLHRNKASRSGENVDFRFYQIKALQVPNGWDRIFVSILSCQTGKTIAKSSKALARNGTCQWTEDITESIWVSQDDSSKEFEDCLYKLLLSTGSSRSGILGEATINITSYLKSATTVSVSVPLKKCNSGTTLQLKIQCLTPRTDLRDDECIETDSPAEDPNNNSLDSEDRSDLSDSATHHEQPRVQVNKRHLKEISISSSGSRSFDEQCDLSNIRSLRNADSSKDLIEAAEDTIEELRKEARMWERNTQKLMLDLEISREEFAGQSMKQTRLEVELSAAKAECDGLRNEVERMNYELEKSVVVDEEQDYREESRAPIQKELEEEMRFLKERNDHLALQLSRSQESNIELVSVLQELEEIVEKQKVEMENLVKNDQSRFDDLERSLTLQLEDNKIKVKKLEESKKDLQAKYETELSAKEKEMVNLRDKLSGYTKRGQSLEADMVKEMDFLKEKLQELERDCNELTDENLDLLFKLKEINGESNQGASATYELASIDYSEKSVSSNSDHDVGEYCHDDKSKKKKITDNKFDLISSKDEKPKLEEVLQLKEAEIEDLRRENVELQENLQVMQRESEATLKCLSELQNDLSVLSKSFDAHVSVNKILERKSLDLERRNFESEFHLSELNRENAQLSDWVSGLEDEIMILKDEIDTNRVEIQQKEQTLKSLETNNGDLRKNNCDLDAKVKEIENCYEKCSVKVETLEESLSLLMEDFALKDTKLSSDLHKLLDENKEQEEQISKLHSLVQLQENEFETKARESMSAKEKLQTSLNQLEQRLTISEYDPQKLAEQENSMKIHLQNMEKFKFEKEKAEASLEPKTTATYKKPHNSLLSESSAHACHVVPREIFERTKSSLESELMELRERYSSMSLKYAEVEAEREELIMKMKASRSGKGWFSR